MVDAGVDIDAIGRKELQALAKNFGIKANQKSVVLREKLREAIAREKRSPPPTEIDNGEDKRVKPQSSIKDISTVCEDAETLKNENELDSSGDSDTTECTLLSDRHGAVDASRKIKEVDLAQSDKKVMEGSERKENEIGKNTDIVGHAVAEKYDNEKNYVQTKRELTSASDNIISVMKEDPTVEKKETDDSVETPEVKALASNGTEIKNGCDNNKMTAKETEPLDDQATKIDVGKDVSVGNQAEGNEQQIETNQKLLKPNNKESLSTKISFGTEKSSIKKNNTIHPNANKDEKFKSRLDQSYRKINATKQVTRAKLPKKDTRQPTEERLKTSALKQREVPLWKVHSRDFIRTRGPEKIRYSDSKKKKKVSPAKHVKRRPFGDRSNNTVGTNVTKKSGSKDDIKRIPPKPQPMSKRNEEQMKKFLERQSAGRKDRAEREQVKHYANFVRS